MHFYGYPRKDGSFGTRNNVVIMSSVVCANAVVTAIARECPGVLAITHDHGCGGTAEIALRVLPNIGLNPNYTSVLVVGLGCEGAAPEEIARRIGESGKPVEYLVIQKEGGSAPATEKGIKLAQRMLTAANGEARVNVGLEHLTLGLKCGGSDAFSGVTANPAVGVAADMLIKAGGQVIVAEITETVGTAQILKRRAIDPSIARKIEAYVQIGVKSNQWYAKRTPSSGKGNTSSVSPGNVEGGISNIVEKSMGCITKWGSMPISDCIPYGVRPRTKGLVMMETDGYDLEALTGMAAGGAQVMIFTTGRGNSVGFVGVPVIKVASNTVTYSSMPGDLDINAGTILDGINTIPEVGRHIFDTIIKVAGGEPVRAEINHQELFAIRQEGFPYPSLKDIARKRL